MTWPDPKCNKNHDAGTVFRRWEHTPDCNRHAPAKVHKNRRIGEVEKEIATIRDDHFLVRARESGAI